MSKYVYKPAAKKLVRKVLESLRHEYMTSPAIRDNIKEAERRILEGLA